MITKVLIYRYGGEWCYRADDAEGFDHSDTLGCRDSCSPDEAIAEARAQFPDAQVELA